MTLNDNEMIKIKSHRPLIVAAYIHTHMTDYFTTPVFKIKQSENKGRIKQVTWAGSSEANCVHISWLSCKLPHKTRLDLVILRPDIASNTFKRLTTACLGLDLHRPSDSIFLQEILSFIRSYAERSTCFTRVSLRTWARHIAACIVPLSHRTAS